MYELKIGLISISQSRDKNILIKLKDQLKRVYTNYNYSITIKKGYK